MPPFISENLQDLIMMMLQVNPVKRINMKELFQHPWYDYIEILTLFIGLISHSMSKFKDIMGLREDFYFQILICKDWHKSNKDRNKV